MYIGHPLCVILNGQIYTEKIFYWLCVNTPLPEFMNYNAQCWDDPSN